MSRDTTLLLRGLPPATRTSKKAVPARDPAGDGTPLLLRPAYPPRGEGARLTSEHSRAVTGAPERAYRLRASLRDAVGPAGSGPDFQSGPLDPTRGRRVRGRSLPCLHQDAGSLERIGCSTTPLRRLYRLETWTVDFRVGPAANQAGGGALRQMNLNFGA